MLRQARKVNEMDAKVRKISRPEGVSIRTALVYDGELNPSVVSKSYGDSPREESYLPGQAGFWYNIP